MGALRRADFISHVLCVGDERRERERAPLLLCARSRWQAQAKGCLLRLGDLAVACRVSAIRFGAS